LSVFNLELNSLYLIISDLRHNNRAVKEKVIYKFYSNALLALKFFFYMVPLLDHFICQVV